jgi:hypothetical protein
VADVAHFTGETEKSVVNCCRVLFDGDEVERAPQCGGLEIELAAYDAKSL